MTSEQPSSDSIEFHSEIPFWRDERVLRTLAQIISAVVVIGLLAFALINILNDAEELVLSLGFEFNREAAGFPIGESDITYYQSI